MWRYQLRFPPCDSGLDISAKRMLLGEVEGSLEVWQNGHSLRKKKKVYREHPRVWGKRLWICPLILNSAAAKSLQSCLTLCNPVDSSPPGSAVPGILQARMLEWVPIAFSSAWKWKVKVKSLSRIQLFTTPWTSAYQAPLYMGFSRQEYWSGVPLPSLNSELYLCEFKHRNT